MCRALHEHELNKYIKELENNDADESGKQPTKIPKRFKDVADRIKPANVSMSNNLLYSIHSFL